MPKLTFSRHPNLHSADRRPYDHAMKPDIGQILLDLPSSIREAHASRPAVPAIDA